MQTILSDGYDLSGGAEGLREEIDVASIMPAGIEYYVITIVGSSGSDACAVVEGEDMQMDPTKCGALVQLYPQTFGPYKISRGNPALIVRAGDAAVGAYTVYALSDGMVDYGR